MVPLELQDVHFAYGTRDVLAGISLRFEAGQTVAIVGPNGSGKTTLLRVAGGVLLPSRGRVLLDGVDLAEIPRRFAARRLAAVPAEEEAVFPFNRFEVDTLLGPEMRSTGEVMGIDVSFGMAFAKAAEASGNAVPRGGGVLVVSVNDRDKATVTPIIRRFHDLGFRILATRGTHQHLSRLGIRSERIFKVGEGRPDIVDGIVSGEVDLLINTPLGKKSQYDDYAMRRAAITHSIPYLTTMSAASAACDALIALRSRVPSVRSIQDRIAQLRS